MSAVPASTTPVVVAERQPDGLFRSALRLWRTRIGVLIVLLLVATAVLGPYIAPHSPTAFVGDPASGRAPGVVFGTDMLGQDVWSRFLNGGRSILLLAAASTVLGVTLGALVGMLAAYSRGKLDDVLMRLMDVILAFPQIMLALVAISTVGPSAWIIIGAVGFTTMPRVARVVRGAAVPVVERDFVSAAEALGEPRLRILVREVLPNVTSPLLVEMTLRLTFSIGLIAGLAFLGFTTDPNAPDWGLMINENNALLTIQAWGVVLPTIAIALLTVGTGLVGDGLARASIGIERGKGD